MSRNQGRAFNACRKIKVIKNLKTIKNTRPDLKIPIVRPNKLKIGTIRKGRDEKNWKVNTYKSGPKKGTKKWVRASRMDVRCSNYLSKSIKENIGKYKSKLLGLSWNSTWNYKG